MHLASVTLENYKAFSGRESVEIRPLTILIGKNSAGKSVVARAPILIARALSSQAEAPLELEFDGLDFGASFLDLVHDRVPHGAITIGAAFRDSEGREISFESKVQHFDEYRLQHVSEFSINFSDGGQNKLKWAGIDPLVEGTKYRLNDSEALINVQFAGLLPISIQGDDSRSELLSKIFETRTALEASLANIVYLGPFREPPKRSYRFPGGVPQGVGPRGTRTPEILGANHARSGGDIVEAVGDWFYRHLGGWRLGITESGDQFSIVLTHPQHSSVGVNLVDVGVGMSQVLPMVVQRFIDDRSGISTRLEIVEQPELHLHPAAHGALADLYVDATRSGSSFVIETHSENFILRIRRAVAEGRFPSSSVVIYWINDEPEAEQRLTAIHVNPDGSVDSWPHGVFSEDYEEVRAIHRAKVGERV